VDGSLDLRVDCRLVRRGFVRRFDEVRIGLAPTLASSGSRLVDQDSQQPGRQGSRRVVGVGGLDRLQECGLHQVFRVPEGRRDPSGHAMKIRRRAIEDLRQIPRISFGAEPLEEDVQ